MIAFLFYMVFISAQYSITIYYSFYGISFIRFSAYINHIYIIYFTEVSEFFISSFISLYSFNRLFLKKILHDYYINQLKLYKLYNLNSIWLSFSKKHYFITFFLLFIDNCFYWFLFDSCTDCNKFLFLLQNLQYLQKFQLMKQM